MTLPSRHISRWAIVGASILTLISTSCRARRADIGPVQTTVEGGPNAIEMLVDHLNEQAAKQQAASQEANQAAVDQESPDATNQDAVYQEVASQQVALQALEQIPSSNLTEPHIPARNPAALGGTAFLETLSGLDAVQREQAIYREIVGGNIPDFLRVLVPVKVASVDGEIASVVVQVMPDYLAIGSNQDYVRIPLNFYTATTIARAWGFILPTRHIVDAIYAQATVKVSPAPLAPTEEMTTIPYLARHERMVQEQLTQLVPGQLVAGHKKDIVISNKLNNQPNRITIYGWHRTDGQPIQPLSNKHEATYADYSHGVRMVSGIVTINGKQRSIYDVLSSYNVAALLSDEGSIDNVRSLMEAVPQPVEVQAVSMVQTF